MSAGIRIAESDVLGAGILLLPAKWLTAVFLQNVLWTAREDIACIQDGACRIFHPAHVGTLGAGRETTKFTFARYETGTVDSRTCHRDLTRKTKSRDKKITF